MSDGESAVDVSVARNALLTLGLLALVLLALVAGGWRLRAFVSGISDLGSYFIPKYQYAADRIAGGELPQWNPYEFGGIPFLATIQPGVFYPPLRLAYAVLSGETAYRVLFVLQVVAAALGTMLLARDLGVRAWPAALAGMWVTQPTWLVRIYDHPVYLNGATWMPLLLLISRRLALAPSARRTGVLALLAALLAVSGYPPLVLAASYLLVLGLPFWLIESDARPRNRHLAHVVAALAGAGVVAALLAAAQLLPLIELARLTNRALEAKAAQARLEDLATHSPRLLFELGMPQMSVGAALTELWRVFGTVLLALGGAAIALRPRHTTTWFLVAAVVLTALLPFGAYAALPLYGFVRFALEWAFLAPLAIYLLAAWGLDALLAGIAPPFLRRHAGALTIAVLAVATAGNWQLLDTRWLGRDFGTPPPVPVVSPPCDVHDPSFRAFWPDGQLRGAMMNGRVRSVAGYEQSLMPARSAQLDELLGVGNGGITPRWAKAIADQPSVASRMSLRCAITPLAPVLELGGFVNLDPRSRTRTLAYLNPNARPRVRLEHEVQLASSPDDARARLRNAPLGGVILEDPGAAADTAATPCPDASASDRVELLRDDPEHLHIATSSTCPAFLVVTDTNVEGWTATLDGAPAPILHADFAFRAVRVPAGSHQIEFRYEAPGLRAGVTASLVGLVLAALLLSRSDHARGRLARARAGAAPPAGI
jgi:hypothetical protein